jgi:copper chaperone NosL
MSLQAIPDALVTLAAPDTAEDADWQRRLQDLSRQTGG